MSARSITIIALVVLSLLFILQNIQTVQVTFLTWSTTMPSAILLTLTLVIGFVIGLFWPRARRKK